MSDSPKRITKVKCKKGLWSFAWEKYQTKTQNWDQYSLSCKDQARPELIECFRKMAKHAADICEIVYFEEKMIASGISFTYAADDKPPNCYLVITAQKELEYSNSPLILNTPARPQEPENGMPDEFCWSNELADDIEKLKEEAWRYIKGERAEMSFFAEQPPADKEPTSDIVEEYQRDKKKLLDYQKELLERNGYLKDEKASAGGSDEVIDTSELTIGA